MKLKLTLIVILTTLTIHILKSQTTSIPDNNFEQALIDLGYDNGELDGFVNTENINTISFLDVSNKGINDLTGIEGFVNINKLYCSNNNLEILNLENNILLDTLWCNDNPLTILNLEENANLVELVVRWTLLLSLDLSNAIELSYLHCEHNNNLNFLNIANGNCSNLSLECNFNASDLCILVDVDIIENIPPEWSKDASASYSDNCTVSISDLSINKTIRCFPNPTKDVIYITGLSNDREEEVTLSIIDIKGTCLQSIKTNENGAFDISSYDKGIYFIKITDINTSQTLRIIKN